jgi:ketosteroid isomerase-like protein
MDPRVARLKQFFETLSPATIERELEAVYAPDARFKDPFNDVHGAAAIREVFAHMYEQVEAPRFVITEAVCEGDQAFLTWDFRFRLRKRGDGGQTIRGATHIQFAPDGRVAAHRDYWDAAEELYEKLPLLGSVMRALKRRVSA